MISVWHTWTIQSDYAVNSFCFDTIDNVVTYAGHPVAVQKDLDVWLCGIQPINPIEAGYPGITFPENSFFSSSNLLDLSHATTLI